MAICVLGNHLCCLFKFVGLGYFATLRFAQYDGERAWIRTLFRFVAKSHDNGRIFGMAFVVFAKFRV